MTEYGTVRRYLTRKIGRRLLRVRQVTVIPAHKKLVKFHQVMLDFSDLTEKLESNAQILNQTLKQL